MLIPSCPIPQRILAGRSTSSSRCTDRPVDPRLRPLLRITSCAWASTCPPRSAGTACEVSSRGPARHGRRSGAAGKHPTPAASACPPLGLWLVLQVRAQELVMQQQGLGGRAAGPNGPPWRPDIPSRRPARREAAAHSLQSDQGGAAAASAPWVRSGLQKQCGPHSLGQRRADGEPEELPDTPLPHRGEPPALSRDPPGGQTERAPLRLGPRIQRCSTGNRWGGSHLRTHRGGGAACGARGGMQDSRDWSAPMHAAEKGHATCVELLAERERDMKTTHKWNWFPPGTAALDIAKEMGRTGIASILSG